MSLYKVTRRIGLISWPVSFSVPKVDTDTFLNLGEIYDKDIYNDSNILKEFNNDLQFLYPFKVKKVNNNFKIYNEEDFHCFRKKYKLRLTTTLHNYKNLAKEEYDNRIAFVSPRLYDISDMKPLFEHPFDLYNQTNISTHCRVFIVLPHIDPIIRGKILHECIQYIKKNNFMFILIGDQYGKNKETTSTLMKRYLLSCGIESEKINKSVCDIFPNSIVESMELLPFFLDITKNLTNDIFIGCPSYKMYTVMSFIQDSKIGAKIQYLCE